MADLNRDSKKRSGRHGRNKSKNMIRSGFDHKPKTLNQPAVICSICNKQLFDMSNALANRTDGTPVHFDCALEKIKAEETPGPMEHIAYIGKGSFALIEYKDKSMSSFFIKRKIPWEKEGEEYSWRKDVLHSFEL